MLVLLKISTSLFVIGGVYEYIEQSKWIRYFGIEQLKHKIMYKVFQIGGVGLLVCGCYYLWRI